MIAAGYNAMTGVMVIVLGAILVCFCLNNQPILLVLRKTADVNIALFNAIILKSLLDCRDYLYHALCCKVKVGKYKERSLCQLRLLSTHRTYRSTKVVMSVFAITLLGANDSLIPWEYHILFADMFERAAGLPVIGAVLGVASTVQHLVFGNRKLLRYSNFNNCHNRNTKEFKKEGIFPVDTFIDGVKDIFASCFLIIAVATGVSVVMTNALDTIISCESLLKDAGGGVVGVLAYLIYLPMSFIVIIRFWRQQLCQLLRQLPDLVGL